MLKDNKCNNISRYNTIKSVERKTFWNNDKRKRGEGGIEREVHIKGLYTDCVCALALARVKSVL